MLALLALAPGAAQALSAAPQALATAPASCTTPGQTCQQTEPSTAAWLTLANGAPLLTQQTLTGAAADEYGTTAAADPSLFANATPYASAPSVGSDVIGTALANLAGTTDPGDTYAIVLKADRTLDVLGPQSSGYQSVVSVPVPGSETLVGVVALAAPPGSAQPDKIVVITASSGFYVYDFNPASPSPLTAEAAPQPAPYLYGTATSPDPDFGGDGAFQCPDPFTGWGGCPNPALGPVPQWRFAVPSVDHAFAVWQAPPKHGEWAGAVSSFAIAYGGALGGSYTVDIFAYESDGLHFIHQQQATAPTGSLTPFAMRYAIYAQEIHLATLSPSTTSGLDTMTSYDTGFNVAPGGPGGAYSYTVNTPCEAPSDAGQVGSLAVDAVDNSSTGLSGYHLTGTSVCAAVVGNQIAYNVQRTEYPGYINPRDGSTVNAPQWSSGTVAIPAGSTVGALDITTDFPCEEYLSQFEAHPTPDGFPATTSNYCSPGLDPYEALVGAAGIVGVQLGYVLTDSGGNQSLELHTSAFNDYEGFGLPPYDGSEVHGNTTTLESLPSAANPSLTMLPLDPAGITYGGHLLTTPAGDVLQVPGTSNPVPIAVMAAPPYYSGAQQQVTPTSTTFTSNGCVGSSSEQSNNVGVFGGVDAEWGGDKYEVEALVQVEASWTQSTEIESCSQLDQQFIAGNFGNNFVADNSLLFRVDTGTNTYLDVTQNSLGIGITGGCDTNHLTNCDPLFDPSGSQYALQTITQLKDPAPNNFYAADDRQLDAEYGATLNSVLPSPGNPSSYPAETGGTPAECSGAPTGLGSGDSGIQDANPFVPPDVPPAPNILEASQYSEVNPSSGGNEAGTSSTLSYDSTKTTTSSAEFSVGAEVSTKIIYAKFGASYSHGWGTESSQAFSSGTQFTGGVFDFTGFYDPYSYALYECKTYLHSDPVFTGAPTTSVPVFFVDYMAGLTADGLPLNFVAPNTPDGTVGQDYAGQVFASGGIPNYTYAVTSGGLPNGLSLDPSTGQIGGTPSVAGTYQFTVGGTDSAGNHASEDDSITINPPLQIPSAMAAAEVGVSYSQALGATGGQSPYTYLLTSTGSLPPGLGINNSTGTIQGTPTQTGTYCFGVYVADSGLPQSTVQTQTCITVDDPLTITTTSLPDAVVGASYQATVAATGGNTAGEVFTSTDLPAWLTLDPSGALSGTPSATGPVTFTVSVSDGAGGSDQHRYTVTVDPSSAVQAPSITSSSSATFDTGSPGTFTVSSTGSPTAVLSESGPLPVGVTFTDNGDGTATLSGSPAGGTTGSYPISITAQNGIAPTASQLFTLQVDELPAMTLQPSDLTVNAGSDASFAATAGGSPAPGSATWEVSTNGGASWTTVSVQTLSFTTFSAFDLGSTNSAQDGWLVRVTFTSSIGSVTSRQAKLTVDYAPGIAQQPGDATVLAGTDAAFTATAAGEPVPTVQWQVSTDGGTTWTDISGATSATLSLHGVPAPDDGNEYRAVFANAAGNVTTHVATLHVQTQPAVTAQPAAETVNAGADASFTAAAGGQPAPTVQWQVSSDGGHTWSPVASGGTAPTLALSGVSAAQDGNEYEAVFTNAAGSATTSAATLTVETGPSITTQPAAETVVAGSDVSFSAAAGGKPAPTVQWQVSIDGGLTWADISGATSPVLTLHGVPASDDQNAYRAVFANAAGTTTTNPATLAVQTQPSVTTQPTGAMVTVGLPATFTAAASGRPTPSVQWLVSTDGGGTWSPVTGGASLTLTLPAVSAGQNRDEFEAVFTNPAGSARSAPAILTVDTPPLITTQPTAQKTAAGGNASFTATATGNPAPFVQWQVSADDGTTWTDISGATAPSMTLTDIPAKDDGQLYRALFANYAGIKISSSARLSVSSAHDVTAQPSTTTVPQGGSATFTVATAGSGALAIQWQFSLDGGRTWTDIPGATSPTLTLHGVAARQNGYLFRAVVSRGGHIVMTTTAAVLVVLGPNRSGTALCTPLRRKLGFRLPHKLGVVIRYTEFLDGHRIRQIRGHHLRLAILLGLSLGRHEVRISATTSRHDQLTIVRRFVGCAQISKRTRVKRPHRRHH